MSICRKPYPSDVSTEEWSLVAPYLLLQREDAGQREHDLREVFNGLRYSVKTGAPWRWMPNDLPPWAAVYQQTQRWLAAGIGAGDRAADGPSVRLARFFGALSYPLYITHYALIYIFTGWAVDRKIPAPQGGSDGDRSVPSDSRNRLRVPQAVR